MKQDVYKRQSYPLASLLLPDWSLGSYISQAQLASLLGVDTTATSPVSYTHLGNCANRVPTFLSALPVQAGCNARSANAADAAKAQSGKDLRPDSRCGPAQAADQNKYVGQLPAQAKCKCGKPGCAQC